MERIVVLGAGVAGFGAAHRLHVEGVKPTLYEKKPYVGGHTASFDLGNGFVFDDGPHVSFTKDERIQEIFAASVGGRFETIQVQVNNHWQGQWIKHPAQCNLHGLPEDLVVAVLRDFVERPLRDRDQIDNYAQWLESSFGKTFAETFPMQYGKKYHTTTADNMSTDWLGPRLYVPDLEEMLRGALSPQTPDVHYVTHFRYPSTGGFVSYLDGHLDKADVKLDHELVAIDAEVRRLQFANGTEAGYEQLISSLPLPALISLVGGAPREVCEAAKQLAWTTCVMVNVGIDRADLSDCQWTYFYDDDYVFTRLSYPHMQSPNNVPPGAGSFQAEIYYSPKYRPLTVASPQELIDPVLRDLERCGLLRESDSVLCTDARISPFANIIFDLDRAPALAIVHSFLDELGIHYCGRYGEWGYQWTDEAFKSGERAAQRALDGMTSEAAP